MAQLYCSTADIGQGWLGHNTVYVTVSPEVLHTVRGWGRAGGWGWSRPLRWGTLPKARQCHHKNDSVLIDMAGT